MDITFNVIILIFISAFYTMGRLISVYAFAAKKEINDVPRDWNWKPKVTIMMSAFNEGKVVYDAIESIMESDYPLDKLEIMVCDDFSKDDTFEWIMKAQERWPNNVIGKRNEKNLGKVTTMMNMSRASNAEILLGTDSDALFHEDAIKQMISCFADPRIGAVGGQIRIKNVNDSYVSQMQAILYIKMYYLFKTLENKFRSTRCLSGPLVAFRRELYLKMIDEVHNRNFLGARITYGEDSFLTYLLQFDQGYQTFTDLDAICWVGTPTSWTAYMKQQIRWRRGALEAWFRLAFNIRKAVNKAGFMAVLICLIPPVSIIAMITSGFYLWIVGQFAVGVLTAVITTAMYAALYAFVYNLTIGRTDPMGKIKNPILSGLAFGMWLPINIYVLTVFSLFTIDDGGWVTRQNADNTG